LNVNTQIIYNMFYSPQTNRLFLISLSHASLFSRHWCAPELRETITTSSLPSPFCSFFSVCVFVRTFLCSFLHLLSSFVRLFTCWMCRKYLPEQQQQQRDDEKPIEAKLQYSARSYRHTKFVFQSK
jgi:hypothetical protein